MSPVYLRKLRSKLSTRWSVVYYNINASIHERVKYYTQCEWKSHKIFIRLQISLFFKIENLKRTVLIKLSISKIVFDEWDLLRLAVMWHKARIMKPPLRIEPSIVCKYNLLTSTQHGILPLPKLSIAKYKSADIGPSGRTELSIQ